MKKNILIVAISLICVSNAMAQKIGIKAGANFSNVSLTVERNNVSNSNFDYLSKVTSFYAGTSLSFKLSNKLSIQPEVSLSFEGFQVDAHEEVIRWTYYSISPRDTKTRYIDETYKIPQKKNSFIYLNLPIMAKYKIINAFSLELGPQLAYLIDAKSSYNDVNNVMTTKSIISELNQLNLSMNFGAEYVLPMGVSFNARYSLGIANIAYNASIPSNENIYTSVATKVFSVGMGYYFKK